MAQKQDGWHYRIEPYRRIPGEEGWSPAPENQAQVWFGFRDKGDDHRCFGVFPSRADAEKAVAILKKQERQPQAAKGDPRGQGYHTSQRRNGTEDEIIIHGPDGRHMAYIWFWEKGWDGPGVGDKTAKADARRIINALNAYQTRPTPDVAADASGRPAKAYHATIGPGPFGEGEAIDIRAPSGRNMAFIGLDPDCPRESRAQAKADAQLIADALNAYQPQRSRQEAEKPMAILKDQERRPERLSLQKLKAEIQPERKEEDKARAKDNDRER